MELKIDNQTAMQVPEGLEDVMLKALDVIDENPEGILELTFVDDREMMMLNADYRGKDQTTDVLSFSFLEEERFPGDDLIGEIFISPLIARKQAGDYGHSYEEEVKFLFVHGLLHVFGHDHENEADRAAMMEMHGKIMPIKSGRV